MPTEFFVQRPSVTPTIYAYSLPDVTSHKGYIKVEIVGKYARMTKTLTYVSAGRAEKNFVHGAISQLHTQPKNLTMKPLFPRDWRG